MKMIVDGRSLETVGVTYNDDEVSTILFGMRLRREHAERGNINVGEDGDRFTIFKFMAMSDELIADFENGVRSVSPGTHEAIRNAFLTFIDQLHHGMIGNTTRYIAFCEYLGVQVIDLFNHGVNARVMVAGEKDEIVLLDDM